MSRNSCKGCEYSQKCELVKMTKYEKSKPQNQAIGFINDEWKRNRSFSTASNWLIQKKDL